LGGAFVDSIGYRPTFVLIACLNLVALPLLPAIFRRKQPSEASPA
jgi:hypothetical protein